MRIARMETHDGPAWVGADGHGVPAWRRIDDPFAAFARGAQPVLGEPLEGALLAPCAPLVIAGIAQNRGMNDHALPIQAWLKSPRSVAPSGTSVRLRRDAGVQVVEGEIAVVIGRETAGEAVTEQNAHEFVLGVTAVNDISSPDRARIDERNFEAKGGVGFTPLGPWIDTEASLTELALDVVVDGEVRASTNASELPSTIAACIAYVAGWVPLGPGDVIMTGAPFSNLEAHPGERVEIRLAGMSLVTDCA